jgi:tetratricopeptide (TPR) repeat protein
MVKDMRSKNVDVDSDVWGYILGSVAKHHKNVSELFELLQEFILVDGYVPHASTWTLIVNSYISRQKYNQRDSSSMTKEMRISIELDLISSFLMYCPYSQIRTTFITKIVQEILSNKKNIHVNGDNDEVNVAEKFLLGIAEEVKEKDSATSIKAELAEGFKQIFLYLSNSQKSMNNDKITLLIKRMMERGISPSSDMTIMHSQIEVKAFLLKGKLEEAEKSAINSIKVFGDSETDSGAIQHFIESVNIPIFQYYLKNRHYRRAEKLLTALHRDVYLNPMNSTPFYGSLINEVIKEACTSNSYDTALKIVEQYHQQGSGTGVNLWNVLLFYASENNKPDEAIFFLDRMRSLNIATNSSVWSSLISSLCHPNSRRIDEALDSLNDMLMFDGVIPTADMCNPIFRALSEQDNYTRALSAINTITKNNINPTMIHYDAVIKSYVQNSDKHNRPITYILTEVFSEMEKHKIVPNIDIYKWLIIHYADKNDTTSIIMIIEYMIKNNIAITEDIMKCMEHIRRFDQVLELVESYSHNNI